MNLLAWRSGNWSCTSVTEINWIAFFLTAVDSSWTRIPIILPRPDGEVRRKRSERSFHQWYRSEDRNGGKGVLRGVRDMCEHKWWLVKAWTSKIPRVSGGWEGEIWNGGTKKAQVITKQICLGVTSPPTEPVPLQTSLVSPEFRFESREQ